MLIYLKVSVVDDYNTIVAYHTVSTDPPYLWRYSINTEGGNYHKTYIYRSMMYSSTASVVLCLF